MLRPFLLALCLVLSSIVCVPVSAQCAGGHCPLRVVQATGQFVGRIVDSSRSRREARQERRQARHGW